MAGDVSGRFGARAASGFLRNVAASDCSSTTLRSYTYDLRRSTALAADVRAAVGFTPVIAALVTWWGGGPQYAVGHLDRVDRVEAAVAKHPRRAIWGAASRGIGIAACVAAAGKAASQVQATYRLRRDAWRSLIRRITRTAKTALTTVMTAMILVTLAEAARAPAVMGSGCMNG
jgi:hypothetical protein